MKHDLGRLDSAAHSGAYGQGSKARPTGEQLRAGNYAKGHLWAFGLPLVIETPMYQPRCGKADGKPFATVQMAHYGYIRGTKGADGDAVDCFIGQALDSELVFVVNQQDKAGGFDEHKVMLGFLDVEAARMAYLGSYELGWSRLGSIVPVSLRAFKRWLKSGASASPEPFQAQEGDDVEAVKWTEGARLVGADLADLMYRLRADDAGEGALLDSLTVADINEAHDGAMLDAMVMEFKVAPRKIEQLRKVMSNAGQAVKVETAELSKPFKSKGTTQVAAVFTMTDGQTVSVFFHNPDSTPNKLAPDDELVSWKWMLNKKDVTILVAPESGKDINPREVGRRIMRLVEKNSEKFQKANAAKAEELAEVEGLKGEVDAKTARIAALDAEIERLEQMAADNAGLVPPVADPALAPVEPAPSDDALSPDVLALIQQVAEATGDTAENVTRLYRLSARRQGVEAATQWLRDTLEQKRQEPAAQEPEAVPAPASGPREGEGNTGRQNGALLDDENAMVGVALLRLMNRGPVTTEQVKQIDAFYAGADGMAKLRGIQAEHGDKSIADLMDLLLALALPEAAGASQDDDADTIEAEGRENTVRTAKGTKLVTGFKVVEGKRLIVSHDRDGNPNPEYPQELQPRDRARQTSQAWIQKTARSLDPDSLGKTQRADTGAPIVGPDRVVESGNGRTLAILEAYRIGAADEYREWLIQEADYFGLDANKIRGMKQPVLVRVRKTAVNREEFAVEANQDDKLAMTATEKARSDAKRLTPAMLAKLEDGDLNSAANRDFLAAFMQSLGDAEAAQYLTTDGKPTAGLIARVQDALFAGAYADDRLLELAADVAKPEIANIINALNAAAPDFMRAAAVDRIGTEMAGERLTDALELSLNKQTVGAILAATGVLEKAKESGMAIEEFLKQGDMFGGTDPAVAAMAVFIQKNNRSSKRLATAFKAMAKFVEAENQRKQSASLFGDDPVKFEDVVAAANRELEKEFGEGVYAIDQADLFAAPQPAPAPEPEPLPEPEPAPEPEPVPEPQPLPAPPAENDLTRLAALKKAAPRAGQAVKSDDPEAIPKLRAKLDYLMAYAELMRKANRLLRQGNDAGLVAMGFKEQSIEALKKPDFAGRTGYPDYEMTNNNGEIRRTRKRLEELERAAAREAAEAEPVAAPEPAPEPVPEPIPEPVNEPRETPMKAKDKAFLQSVIQNTVPDILDPAVGDEIGEIYERNAGDAEVLELIELAVNAYQRAMEEATASL